MRTTVNQLFAEQHAIQQGHLQLQKGEFFPGAFQRAVYERVVRYPLHCVYYNTGGINKRTNQITLFIIVADRVYKDYNNLNDTKSDTMQCVEDIVDIMTHSRRWNRIGRVESAPLTLFIDGKADEVTGHMATVTLTLFDRKALCDLPMIDYDFGGSLGASCAPVTVTDSDGVTVVDVASGGSFACMVIEPVTGQNSDDTFSFTAQSGENVPLPDVTVSLGDGDLLFPSVKNISLPDYYPLVFLPSGTYTPANIAGSFVLPWENATGNVTTGTGTIQKITGSGWNGSASALLNHYGDFNLSFNMRLIGGSDCMFGLSFQKSNNNESECDFAFYRSGTIALVYEKGINKTGAMAITDGTLFSIERAGNQVTYYMNGNTIRTVIVTSACPMNLDCSIFNGCIIENITVQI